MTKKTTKKDDKDEVPSAPAVFDVSKPGETAAHPTSKPVIVGHTSTLKQDPMVAPASEMEEAEDKKDNISKKAELVVQPISEDQSDEEEASKEEKDSSEDEEEKAEPDSDDKPEQDSEPKADEKPDSSDSGEIEALASEAESKKQSKKELEEEKKEEEKIKELANSKKYFLPIREGGKKRSGEIMMIWFLLTSILITAAAWFVIDAGYYDPGFELPYDFIKN
ncbi:hypothetical protein HZB74_00390 [Candidatus Saccharibacteria bacterium]|nr:hypothetical protein [Candidatus Saccharibacteria bacterium]